MNPLTIDLLKCEHLDDRLRDYTTDTTVRPKQKGTFAPVPKHYAMKTYGGVKA
jgi:hypothetical protein